MVLMVGIIDSLIILPDEVSLRNFEAFKKNYWSYACILILSAILGYTSSSKELYLFCFNQQCLYFPTSG